MKKNMWILFTILGIINILYFVALLGFSTRISFSGFFALAGCAFLFLAFIFYKNMIFNNKFLIMLLNWGKIILILFLTSFVIIQSLIIYHGNRSYTKKTDYLVILGAGLNGDKLSLSLLKRMEKSVEYLKLHPDSTVVVSGGQGLNETISEAEAMKRYLVSQGIKEEQIIKEDKSTNTMENLKFTKNKLDEINKKEGNYEITIVTSGFHMFRSKSLAARNGFKAYGYPSSTYAVLIPNFYIREYFAVIKSFVFDR